MDCVLPENFHTPPMEANLFAPTPPPDTDTTWSFLNSNEALTPTSSETSPFCSELPIAFLYIFFWEGGLCIFSYTFSNNSRNVEVKALMVGCV